MNTQSRKSVAVIYHSTTGTTKQLADAVAGGVVDGGADVAAFRIAGEDIRHGRFINRDVLRAVGHADAIIMGSPTYMGGISAQFKAFADDAQIFAS